MSEVSDKTKRLVLKALRKKHLSRMQLSKELEFGKSAIVYALMELREAKMVYIHSYDAKKTPIYAVGGFADAEYISERVYVHRIHKLPKHNKNIEQILTVPKKIVHHELMNWMFNK